MAWSKLEDSFREHRKLKRMAVDLKIRAAEARGLMSGLWSWAQTQAPDGDLSDHTEVEIEEGMDWKGKPGAAYRSAIDQTLIDTDEKGVRLHGYMKRAEAHRTAQRVAKHRKKKQRMAIKVKRYSTGTVPEQYRNSTVERRGEERRGEEKRGEEKTPMSSSRSATPTARDVDDVIAHYQTHHPRAKPGDKERKKIRKRLKEGYSVADLCKAIDGCHVTPHNTGQNNRNQTYLKLELIMRDSDHVNSYLENADRHAPGSINSLTLTDTTRHNLAAAKEFLERTDGHD